VDSGIVAAVDTAISAAEAATFNEATKVETAIVTEVKACGAHIFACVRCHLTKAEAEAKHVATEAELDAQEDADAIRGAFSRFLHRAWKAV
jgi:hypothetical protein